MQAGQAPRPAAEPARFRSICSRCRTDLKSRCGRPRRCCTTRPTSISTDGRIWVAEGVRYRSHLRPPARRRSHRRAAGHRRRRQGRQDAHVRAGAGADRAARRRGHRQQDHRLAAARPHRLHRRRSKPALRSGGRQARGAADRLPGHQSRSLAAFGDVRSRRQVDLQLRQHRRDVHRQVGKDVPDLRLVSSRARLVRSSTRTTRRCTPASRATTGTSTSAGSRCA